MDSEKKHKMNVLINCDENYLRKSVVMLNSLKRHTKQDINLYVLGNGFSEKIKEDFKKLFVMGGGSILFASVPEKIFENLPLNTFTIEMYYRIICQFILPPEVDRVLYLDADIIVKKDLQEFYNQDFQGNYLVACQDGADGREGIIRLKERLGLPKEHKYFNSGVLLLNVDLLRKNTTLAEISDKINSVADKIVYPDQDILNLLYKDKVKYADSEVYNHVLGYYGKVSNKLLRKIAIIHYAGVLKPWNVGVLIKGSKYWWFEAIRLKKRMFWQMLRLYFSALKDKWTQ